MKTKLSIIAISIATLLSQPLYAQQENTSENEEVKDKEIEVISVTGSRIKRKELTSASPMTVVDSTILDSFGSNSLEDMMQAFPVFQNTDISDDSSGFDDLNAGQQRANIRGVGAERTLNLLNGKRWVTSGFAASNIGDIPTAMIERIEILRDGASSVYGSDAMAGVVNIITKKDFTGLDVTAKYGANEQGDGAESLWSITAGAAGDKGHVLVGVQSTKNSGVYRSGDYSKYSCTQGITEGADGSRSCDSTDSRFGIHPAGLVTIGQDSPDGKYLSGEQYLVENGTPRLYHAATDAYHWPWESLRSENERNSIYIEGRYELSDDVDFFFDVLGARSKTVRGGRVDYNAIGGSVWGQVNVAADNSFNPFGTDVEIGRVLTEAGPTNDIGTGTMYRFVAGLEGVIFDDYYWDISFNTGESNSDHSQSRLNTANIPSSFLTTDGISLVLDEAACAQVKGCTPVNFFGANTVTDDQAQFLKFQEHRIDTFKNSIIQANISGDLFELPAGDLLFAAGLEYREESGAREPGPREYNRATNGSYTSKEVYMETVIPVIEDFEVELAGRYVKNSIYGSNSIFNVGVNYKATDDIRLRATYASTFRVPNIENIFFGQDYGPIWPITLGFLYPIPGNIDPCDMVNGEAASNTTVAANCASDGVPSDYEHTDYQFQPGIIGNRNIKKETGTMETVGVIFTPTFVENLSVTLDYYKLDIEDGINQSFGDFGKAAGYCYVNENQDWCDLISRKDNGQIGLLNIAPFNTAALTTTGLDASLQYSWDTNSIGLMTISTDVNYLLEYDANNLVGEEPTDYVGYDGHPEWSGVLFVGWSRDDWSANYRVSFDSGARLRNPADTNQANEYGAQMWHHASTTYTTLISGVSTSVTFGIKNLFDEEVPYSTNQYATDRYDPLGRKYFVEMSASF